MAAAAIAHAAGLSGFPRDFALGLLPLVGAGEFARGELGFGAGAASDFGAGADGFSISLCWKRQESPLVHVPSLQNLQVALIFFLVLGGFAGERERFL